MNAEAELHSTSETVPLSVHPFAHIEAGYSRSAVVDSNHASSQDRGCASPATLHDDGNGSFLNRAGDCDVERPARRGTSIGRFSLSVSHEPPTAVLPRNRALPPISLKHTKTYASSHSSPSAKRDWPNRTKSLNGAQADLISALEAASPAKPRAPSRTVSGGPNNLGKSNANVGPYEQPTDSMPSPPAVPSSAQTQDLQQSPQNGSHMLNELHSQLQELQVRPLCEAIAFVPYDIFYVLSAPCLPL